MPIDKLTPRQLDADSDSKLVKKTAMLDALNLYSGDSEGGGRGVLKNIKGNDQWMPSLPHIDHYLFVCLFYRVIKAWCLGV